jgi:hypothetical protein
VQKNRKIERLISLKVICGDPARSSDAFGWIGAAFDLDKFEIQFKLAKQFWKTPYALVASWAMDRHKEIKPNYMAIEINGRGKEVLNLFTNKYKMDYMQGITTSGELTEKTRQMGFAMDKAFMVQWFRDAQRKGMLKFPSYPGKDMQEYMDQIAKISEFKTLGGQTTYRAYRGQHDDLFMAGLFCCNFIRLFIDQQARLK